MNKLKVIKKDYTNLIVFALLLVVLILMTVGFSYYQKTLSIGGSVILYGNGNIYISNVQTITLRNATATPTYDASSVDFNLIFDNANQSNNTDYSAVFDVTITNDSVFDYTWHMPNYHPTVYGINTEQYYDTSLVSYSVSGISTGDTIPSKTTLTYRITVTFTNPQVNAEQFEIDGAYHETSSNQEVDTGSLIASAVLHSGDLRGSNAIANYQMEVINTYSTAKTFTISTTDSAKFVATTSGGNTPVQYTIPANTTQTYNFSLMKANNAQYGTGTQRVDMLINDGTSNINANYVVALVDQNVFYPDTTAPEIWGVSATMLNDAGQVAVSWSGTDNVAVDHYSVIVFDSSDTEVTRVSTSDASTSITVTGLGDGNYYFTVIGYDTATPSNTATSEDISRANTGRGHASRTNETNYTWYYSIQLNLTGLNSSNSATSITRGSTYETTLSAPSQGTGLPYANNVTITMGGQTVNNAYNESSGLIRITSVTGNIVITASARDTGGGCLAFGTKILLADGTYKNVEDITYEDLLCVYDHVTGEFTAVYPVWVEKPMMDSSFERVTFSDGTLIDFVNKHCIYDVDLRRYVDVTDRNEFHVGTRVYKVNNQKLEIVSVDKIEVIEQDVWYSNVVTAVLYNIIANNLLTTEANSSISNVYGFVDNAIYSDNYQKVCEGPKLPYELVAGLFPYYVYKGLNLQNAYSLLNTTFQYNLVSRIVFENTIIPEQKDGKYCFIATIQLKDSIQKFDILEGDTFVLPSGAEYYIETSTGTRYYPGEEATIYYNTHFIAK